MPGSAATPASRRAPAAQARARILAAVRAIPRGQVAGYGEVAARAGLPGRARLAARVLADNDDPSLPWHRVLRADGRIAFAPGSRQWREQARRLRAEGVAVRDGRVARRPRTLDAALWGPGAD
jgi:methylated-DNA-protein-cysteine methyltransferase related protein